MATTQDYAILSLYVYNVARPLINQPLLPTGWTLAEPLHRDDLLGFSYGVFRNACLGSGLAIILSALFFDSRMLRETLHNLQGFGVKSLLLL